MSWGLENFLAGSAVSAPSAGSLSVRCDLRFQKFRRRDARNLPTDHQPVITYERYGEAHEPGVVIPEAKRWNDKAHQRHRCAQSERGNSSPIEAARIFIGSAPEIEVIHQQRASADQVVVADHDARDRPKECRISPQPAKDKSLVIVQKFPGHDGNAHEAGDHAAGLETDLTGPEVGKIIRGR